VEVFSIEQLEWIVFQEYMMDIFCFFWKSLLEQQSKSLRGAARTDFSVYICGGHFCLLWISLMEQERKSLR
jgi:hypothetical protein